MATSTPADPSIPDTPRWLVAARFAVAASAGVLATLALVSWWRAVGPEGSPGPFPPGTALVVGLALVLSALLMAVAPDRARRLLSGLAVGGLLVGVNGMLGYAAIGDVPSCVEARQASLVASSWPADLPCDALRASRAVGGYQFGVGLVSAAAIAVLALGRGRTR